ncbi:MAG: gliding motility-associated C-terminal domain-containing protein [Saprospiraceae bacterium]|nr:gliding motility-associated C-terminal domain-containing protein [Saprospiraceae bacterium]
MSFAWFVHLPSAFGTHNRAGEITFRQIGSLTIEMTITTYTKTSSQAADRDSLEFFWGDNTSEFIKRDNSLTRSEANDVKINYYIARHTYPGPATYTMYFVDPNRVGTILNINYPNSIDIPFFLSTTFTLLNQQFQGPNNSVILLQPPLDIACAGKKFIHNPNGYDPDGDSLVYELAVPLQAVNLPVPLYLLPDQILPGPNNKISINGRTGEFIWDAPVLLGEYNIAIKISEYRNGVLISSVLRDMQILVRACVNDPPSILVDEEICVLAGEKIDLPLFVDDINNGQKVKLFVTGGPMNIADPAMLITPGQFSVPPFTSSFVWQTTCDHISKDYYQLVFRAMDNYFGDTSGLATLKTVRIKVVGPPPKDVEIFGQNEFVDLAWNGSYFCDENQTKKFTGFSIYRSTVSIPLEIDTCDPGLKNSPYTKIALGSKTILDGKYVFRDVNVERGKSYCYRIVAQFSLVTSSGIPYEIIEGLASEEVCVQLSRELPLWTQVSVVNTDVTLGSIQLRWSKPLLSALDENMLPPPYTFEFYRSSDSIDFVLLQDKTKTVASLQTFSDTAFIDNQLNTAATPFYYKIRMLSQSNEVGLSAVASSVFASINPSDNRLEIVWNEEVPWSNFLFDVYKEKGNVFEYIGTTTERKFLDTDVVNGKTYCYKVESAGTYNTVDLRDTLFNFSQIICGIPVDNVPPCQTTITVKNPCELIQSATGANELFNLIEWNNPKTLCNELAEDLAGYRIYYAENQQSPYNLLMEITQNSTNSYIHYNEKGIAGCYYVTSLDSLGNESLPSNIICVENCPLYVLPNTFTPNGDGKNDVFKPIANFFISSVDFKVYNQWGNLVYQTTSPELNWDGTTFNGKILADGVYHYVCSVNVSQIDGSITEESVLKGFIQIIK